MMSYGDYQEEFEEDFYDSDDDEEEAYQCKAGIRNLYCADKRCPQCFGPCKLCGDQGRRYDFSMCEFCDDYSCCSTRCSFCTTDICVDCMKGDMVEQCDCKTLTTCGHHKKGDDSDVLRCKSCEYMLCEGCEPSHKCFKPYKEDPPKMMQVPRQVN